MVVPFLPAVTFTCWIGIPLEESEIVPDICPNILVTYMAKKLCIKLYSKYLPTLALSRSGQWVYSQLFDLVQNSTPDNNEFKNLY